MFKALYSHLINDPALLQLNGERVFPEVKEQGEHATAVVYTQVSKVPTIDLCSGETQSVAINYQLDCYALTYVAAQALADAVRGALHFKTRLHRTNIDRCIVSDASDSFDSGEKFYRVTLALEIYTTEL